MSKFQERLEKKMPIPEIFTCVPDMAILRRESRESAKEAGKVAFQIEQSNLTSTPVPADIARNSTRTTITPEYAEPVLSERSLHRPARATGGTSQGQAKRSKTSTSNSNKRKVPNTRASNTHLDESVSRQRKDREARQLSRSKSKNPNRHRDLPSLDDDVIVLDEEPAPVSPKRKAIPTSQKSTNTPQSVNSQPSLNAESNKDRSSNHTNPTIENVPNTTKQTIAKLTSQPKSSNQIIPKSNKQSPNKTNPKPKTHSNPSSRVENISTNSMSDSRDYLMTGNEITTGTTSFQQNNQSPKASKSILASANSLIDTVMSNATIPTPPKNQENLSIKGTDNFQSNNAQIQNRDDPKINSNGQLEPALSDGPEEEINDDEPIPVSFQGIEKWTPEHVKCLSDAFYKPNTGLNEDIIRLFKEKFQVVLQRRNAAYLAYHYGFRNRLFLKYNGAFNLVYQIHGPAKWGNAKTILNHMHKAGFYKTLSRNWNKPDPRNSQPNTLGLVQAAENVGASQDGSGLLLPRNKQPNPNLVIPSNDQPPSENGQPRDRNMLSFLTGNAINNIDPRLLNTSVSSDKNAHHPSVPSNPAKENSLNSDNQNVRLSQAEPKSNPNFTAQSQKSTGTSLPHLHPTVASNGGSVSHLHLHSTSTSKKSPNLSTSQLNLKKPFVWSRECVMALKEADMLLDQQNPKKNVYYTQFIRRNTGVNIPWLIIKEKLDELHGVKKVQSSNSDLPHKRSLSINEYSRHFSDPSVQEDQGALHPGAQTIPQPKLDSIHDSTNRPHVDGVPLASRYDRYVPSGSDIPKIVNGIGTNGWNVKDKFQTGLPPKGWTESNLVNGSLNEIRNPNRYDRYVPSGINGSRTSPNAVNEFEELIHQMQVNEKPDEYYSRKFDGISLRPWSFDMAKVLVSTIEYMTQPHPELSDATIKVVKSNLVVIISLRLLRQFKGNIGVEDVKAKLLKLEELDVFDDTSCELIDQYCLTD
ncbi:hypothetical protein QCA50_012726 [Cerrena zonata]|uniref:Uncharacterized protein n=1 Tax=Cerrena zonata TaxID=2478898 RepID=A0AAW0G115_9APHY